MRIRPRSPRPRPIAIWVSALSILALGSGCDPGTVSDVASNRDGVPTYAEFLASTYQEPDTGIFIVNGDETVANEKELREFYDALYGGAGGALIVHAPNGTAVKWDATQRMNLTYCVSDGFGNRKQTVVDAMAAAAGAWEAATDVNYDYLAGEDANCTAQNTNVVFDVNPTSGQPYTMRAFFPDDVRADRNVLIDSTAFGNLGAVTVTGVLRHELGHTLGFRHEHTRPEAAACFEDNAWLELTPYDSASVMHYPQCNGTGTDLSLTSLDVTGAQALYGAPGGGGGNPQDPPDPTPPPDQGTPQQGSDSGTVAAGEDIFYEPMSVLPGTRFAVQLSGVGDADLYVRFGAAPTATQFDCRPYSDGSDETCILDVPAGAQTAHIAVSGWTDASYQLVVEWTAP